MAALIAGAAFAQSAVTISGQVDVGLQNPIGPQKTRIDQSANGANQIVFAGAEDLGGGLKATFRLAQRFSPESGLNDGSAGNRPTWQGESTVGLAGAFGSLRIGRALTALQAPLTQTDPWTTYQVASVSGLLASTYATASDNVPGSGSGLARTDGIFYTTPDLGGFVGALTLSPKSTQVSGATVEGAHALVSAWLAYTAGPAMLGAGTERNRVGDRLSAVQAGYDFGMAQLAGTFTWTNLEATTVDRRSFNIGAIVPLGQIVLKAGIGRSKLEHTSADIKKVGLGLDYVLSKRTRIYTSYGRDSALASSKSGFDLGIRHNF